jgi:hypothetical protein
MSWVSFSSVLGIGRSVARVPPNLSLKGRSNGGPPGPGRRYGVHFRQPGPGVPPSASPLAHTLGLSINAAIAMPVSRRTCATLTSTFGCAAVVGMLLFGMWVVGKDWDSSDNSALHGATFLALAALPAPLFVAFAFPHAARFSEQSDRPHYLSFLAWSCGILAATSLLGAAILVWLLGASTVSADTVQLTARFAVLAFITTGLLVGPWSYLISDEPQPAE